ncbi:MAG: glycosyltransferase [Anaerolineae bacterium]|nr:glycosyltransferase [Anaerolineae bacterium]
MSLSEQDISYSVIVPAYQAADVVGACVAALARQTVPRERYEILVVDDGSTDATAAEAERAGADRVIRLAQNGGPSVARNAGIAAAHGDILLFTDSDCVPRPEWLALMTAPFDDPQIMGTKGTYRTLQPALLARLVQLEFEIRYERMRGMPFIDFIDTYAAAYRRSLLVEYGGFDTAFPAAEDVDLSFRLAKAGHRLLFVPDAWVTHRHPATLSAYLLRKARFGYWRAFLYMRYPEKIAGDTHTDPSLKVQFALVALIGLLVVGGAFWPLLWPAAAILLLWFVLTTLSFVRWAWPRDRAVALAWPAVTFLRVLLQGGGLALGLLLRLARR